MCSAVVRFPNVISTDKAFDRRSNFIQSRLSLQCLSCPLPLRPSKKYPLFLRNIDERIDFRCVERPPSEVDVDARRGHLESRVPPRTLDFDLVQASLGFHVLLLLLLTVST